MPSTTNKQVRFMRAVAHDPAFAARVNVPQSVGKDFAAADEAKANPNKKKPTLRIGRKTYEMK